MQTEERYVENHGTEPLPPVVSILCDAAERWQWAYYEARQGDATERAANYALSEAVTAWINSPYRQPAAVDRGAVRGILDGFASHLLQMDARFRSGQFAEESTYHSHRDELTARVVAQVLQQVGYANPKAAGHA